MAGLNPGVGLGSSPEDRQVRMGTSLFGGSGSLSVDSQDLITLHTRITTIISDVTKLASVFSKLDSTIKSIDSKLSGSFTNKLGNAAAAGQGGTVRRRGGGTPSSGVSSNLSTSGFSGGALVPVGITAVVPTGARATGGSGRLGVGSSLTTSAFASEGPNWEFGTGAAAKGNALTAASFGGAGGALVPPGGRGGGGGWSGFFGGQGSGGQGGSNNRITAASVAVGAGVAGLAASSIGNSMGTAVSNVTSGGAGIDTAARMSSNIYGGSAPYNAQQYTGGHTYGQWGAWGQPTTGMLNWGSSDLTQALGQMQANPFLYAAPGSQSGKNLTSNVNALERMNPSIGASGAMNELNTMTSNQALQFLQMRGQLTTGGGLYNAKTGQINNPQTAFTTFMEAATGSSDPKQWEALSKNSAGWAKVQQNLQSGAGFSAAEALSFRQVAAAGGNVSKTALKGSPSETALNKATAQTAASQTTYEQTTGVQNWVNDFGSAVADFKQAVSAMPEAKGVLGAGILGGTAGSAAMGALGSVGKVASLVSGLAALVGDPTDSAFMGDPTGSTSVSDLGPTMSSRVAAMMKDNPRLKITSGRRTSAQQAFLHALKGGKQVSKPGSSKHQQGKAADVGPPSQFKWLAKNAKSYGLWHPSGKEPWHVEAMGDPTEASSSSGTVSQASGTGNQVGLVNTFISQAASTWLSGSGLDFVSAVASSIGSAGSSSSVSSAPISGSTSGNPSSSQLGTLSGGPTTIQANSAVVDAVKSVTSNKEVQLAMLTGSALESNQNPSDVGKGSYGAWQIQMLPGRNVTPQQAQNVDFAAKFMVGSYTSAVGRVSSGLWQSDPEKAAEQAAYFAERPAADYYSTQGAKRVSSAYNLAVSEVGDPASSSFAPSQQMSGGNMASVTSRGSMGARPISVTIGPIYMGQGSSSADAQQLAQTIAAMIENNSVLQKASQT